MKDRRTMTPRLLTMQEAAIYLNIPLNTLYKMVSHGKVPLVKINRLNRFDQSLLDEWIKKNTRMPIY
jgi:excisionase family DNA binding protein